MATVIDTLIVELQLDPKKMTPGQKKALEDVKKFAAGARKEAAEVEAANKKVADSFGEIGTKALSFAAVLVGASSIEQFIGQQVRLGIDLGRNAGFLGLNVSALSAWQNAAVIAGGSAEDMAASMSNVRNSVYSLSVSGKPTEALKWFRQWNIALRDDKGNARDMTAVFADLADHFSKLDPGKARYIGAQMGIGDQTIANLMMGRDAWLKIVDTAKAAGVATDADTVAAKSLNTAWQNLSLTVTGLFRKRQTESTPFFVSALDELTGVFHGKFDLTGGGKDPVYNALRNSLDDHDRAFLAALGFDSLLPTKASTVSVGDQRKRLLDSIAGGESGGAYNIEYGGSKFSSYAAHPNAPHLITSGPNRGRYSTAAGRYQLLYSTWLEAQRALGLKDFSPANQDRAAWWLAQRDYRARTRRDLAGDLADPARMQSVLRSLAATWTSLPGGIEAHHTAAARAVAQANLTAPGAAGARPGLVTGAVGLAASGAVGGDSRHVDLSRNEININNVNVTHSAAQNGADLSRDLTRGLRNNLVAVQANGGPQ